MPELELQTAKAMKRVRRKRAGVLGTLGSLSFLLSLAAFAAAYFGSANPWLAIGTVLITAAVSLQKASQTLLHDPEDDVFKFDDLGAQVLVETSRKRIRTETSREVVGGALSDPKHDDGQLSVAESGALSQQPEDSSTKP